MSNTDIDIPVTVAGSPNAATVDLSTYSAENRTFTYAGPAGSTVAIFASGDGTNWTVGPLLTLAANSKAVTLNDRSFRYRATPSTAGGKLTVDVGPLEDDDVIGHFNTLALGNFATGGVVTTSANLDEFGAFTIAQTTAGQTLTFPAPTDPSATYVRWVENIGTQDFTLYGLLVIAGSATKIVWNGSAWTNGCIGTSTSLRSVWGAGGKNVGDSDGQNTSIGNNEATVAGSTLALIAGAGGLSAFADSTGKVQISTDAGAIEMDSNGGDIGIGSISAFAKNATLGNTLTTSKTNIQGGTQVGGGGVGINQAAPKAGLHVNGALLLQTLGTPVADGTGSLGTAAATVDVASVLEVNQTTPVITYANMRLIQPPTNATAHGRKLTIYNVGTAAFIVGDAIQKQGVNLIPGTVPGAAASANKGQGATFTWNGTAWIPDDTGPGVPCQGGNIADDGDKNVVRAGRCTVYHVPALANNRVYTLILTGVLIGDQIGVIRDDGANANTLTLRNNATTTLAVMPASKKATFWAEYNGTDWQLLSGGAF